MADDIVDYRTTNKNTANPAQLWTADETSDQTIRDSRQCTWNAERHQSQHSFDLSLSISKNRTSYFSKYINHRPTNQLITLLAHIALPMCISNSMIMRSHSLWHICMHPVSPASARIMYITQSSYCIRNDISFNTTACYFKLWSDLKVILKSMSAALKSNFQRWS